MPAAGILVRRLRPVVPPANGWPTGDYFCQSTYFGSQPHPPARPVLRAGGHELSMMYIALELLDRLLLLLDDGFHQVAD